MEFELQRPETGKWASAVFSLLMHAGLVLVLYYGVQWQRREPEPISVELVASLPPMTAPPPVEDRPAPPPPKPVEIKPVEVKPAPLAKPDIALKEPEKKKPVKKEEPKPVPPPTQSKPVAKPDKTPEVKPVEKKAEPPKLSRQDELMNQALKQTDQAKKDAKMAESAADARAAANAAAASASIGKAGNDWVARIAAKVRSNIPTIRPAGVTGNPELGFEVDLIPGATGATILGEPRLVKGSGNTQLDEMVRRAIIKSDPLPMPEKHEVFQRKLPFRIRPLEE